MDKIDVENELKFNNAKIGRVVFCGKFRTDAIQEVHDKFNELKNAFIYFLDNLMGARSENNAWSLNQNKKVSSNESKIIKEIRNRIGKMSFENCFPRIKEKGTGKRFFNFDALMNEEWGFVGCTVRFFREFIDILKRLNELTIIAQLNNNDKHEYDTLVEKTFNGSLNGIYAFINKVANKFYTNCLSSNAQFDLGAYEGMDADYCEKKRKQYLRLILDDYVQPGKDEDGRERGKIDYIFYIDGKYKVSIFDMNSDDEKNALINMATNSCPRFTDKTNSGKPANRIEMPDTKNR